MTILSLSAEAKPRKKTSDNMELVALSKSDSSGGGALSMGKSTPYSSANDSNLSAKLVSGIVTGFPIVEGNPFVYGIDGQYKITSSFFALIGYSTWSGSGEITVINKLNGVPTDSKVYDVSLATTTIDTGLGYRWRMGKGNVDLGTRIGWVQIKESVKDYEASLEGYNVTPFVGFGWKLASKVNVGFEERCVIPVIGSKDKEDDPDTEVQSKGGGLPLYSLLNLGYSF